MSLYNSGIDSFETNIAKKETLFVNNCVINTYLKRILFLDIVWPNKLIKYLLIWFN